MEELKVIADFYDFMLWLVQHTEKFPRQHRYSLGIVMAIRVTTTGLSTGRQGRLERFIRETPDERH